MLERNVFVLILALCSMAALSCDEQSSLGVSPGDTPFSLNTAAGEETRTVGLATARCRNNPSETEWPPEWDIAIRFPPTMMTPGFNGLNGEGTVTETKWSQLEKDIVWEINKFRNDPVKWCKENGLPMLDGITAEQEFISGGPRVSNYKFPAQPVYPSPGLHKAALHQCVRGSYAHSDVSRVKVYVGFSAWSENLAHYMMNEQASGGATIAARIVNTFIQDSGVANKGHRIAIANPRWDRVGIGCINNLIIMQFASGVKEKNP
jgi:uncharacterized protein YkwD